MSYLNHKTNRKKKLILASVSLVMAFGLTGCNQTEPLQEQPLSKTETAVAKFDFSSQWLHIREQGLKSPNAPNLVLIPGLVSSSAVWDGVVSELGKTHHLHIVDISGFAELPASGAVDKGVVTGITDDLATYIDTKKLRNVTLMGHSMGGFTSLIFARDHGELVDTVITVDSLPFYPVIFNPAATVETTIGQAKAMGDMILALDDQAFEQMQKQTVMRLSKNETAQAQILSWSLSSDRQTMVQAIRDLMTSDLRPDLQNITTDVHVIYAWDKAMGVPADMGRLYENQYQDLQNVQFTRIENSFHFIMKDQPEEFLTAVQNALNIEH